MIFPENRAENTYRSCLHGLKLVTRTRTLDKHGMGKAARGTKEAWRSWRMEALERGWSGGTVWGPDASQGARGCWIQRESTPPMHAAPTAHGSGRQIVSSGQLRVPSHLLRARSVIHPDKNAGPDTAPPDFVTSRPSPRGNSSTLPGPRAVFADLL